MGGLDIEARLQKAEKAILNNPVRTGLILFVGFIIVVALIIGAILIYHFWFHSSSDDSSSSTDTPTAEEEASILKSVAKKLVGTRKYYQLYPIANKYLDSASSGNPTYDITSGKPATSDKGNCFYSDNDKYAVYIDENSYILLLKAINKAAGVWEISKVLYDGDSSNGFTEAYSLFIKKEGDPNNFTSASKTDFILRGSTPVTDIKAFHPLLTFGSSTNASNYRLYIDESSGKVRVRVYGSTFNAYDSDKDVEVVAF